MNRALWQKMIRESAWMLAGCVLVAFAFNWMYVWIVSLLPLAKFRVVIGMIPQDVLRLLPIPVEQLTTTHGRIAMSYAEPVVLVVISAWAVGRGSDVVSGELGRGTMEMLLAQPVRRAALLWNHALATTLGAGWIAAAAWCGTAVGLHYVPLEVAVQPAPYALAAANLFGLMFFLGGATSMVSAVDRYRWRTLGIVGSFFVAEKILEIVSQASEAWRWLEQLTFFTLFKPPRFVTDPGDVWRLAWQYNGLLVGMGLAGYVAAAVLFCRRDLPAPL